MGMQTKYLRKLCGRLREDGLLSVHAVPEMREGAQRPFNRDYYYINFHRAIDVIKYRLKKMTRQIEQRFSQTVEEKKDYFCVQCKAEYTQMEVLDMSGPMGFECRRCGAELTYLDTTGQPHMGHEIQSKLNAQLSPFEDLMKQIDNTSIPENDFETARANHRPVQRDAVLNPAARTTVLSDRDASRLPPTSVRGTRIEPEKIQLNLTDNSQAAKDLESAAEAERRAKLASQNALPAWYTTSTVTGEQTGLAAPEDTIRGDLGRNGTNPKTEPDDEKKIKPAEDHSALSQYFAALKEEQEREAKEELEEQGGGEDDDEDEEDDEDDEADFEDVGLGKEELPAPKRVKIQEPETEGKDAAALATGGTATSTVAGEAGEDSDEDEFEDVT